MSAIHAAVSSLSDSNNVYCFGNYKIGKRGGFFFTNGTNVSGGQANVVPGHRSRIKTNISR